jgi:hypothetical protein
LGKVRVVYINGCFDEYFEKLRAGLQSNFLSPALKKNCKNDFRSYKIKYTGKIYVSGSFGISKRSRGVTTASSGKYLNPRRQRRWLSRPMQISGYAMWPIARWLLFLKH